MKFNIKCIYIALTIVSALNCSYTFPVSDAKERDDWVPDGIKKVVIFLQKPTRSVEDVTQIGRSLATSGLNEIQNLVKAPNRLLGMIDPTTSAQVNEKVLNPILNEVQTIARLADLVVQLGQQVLPTLITNATLKASDAGRFLFSLAAPSAPESITDEVDSKEM